MHRLARCLTPILQLGSGAARRAERTRDVSAIGVPAPAYHARRSGASPSMLLDTRATFRASPSMLPDITGNVQQHRRPCSRISRATFRSIASHARGYYGRRYRASPSMPRDIKRDVLSIIAKAPGLGAPCAEHRRPRFQTSLRRPRVPPHYSKLSVRRPAAPGEVLVSPNVRAFK